MIEPLHFVVFGGFFSNSSSYARAEIIENSVYRPLEYLFTAIANGARGVSKCLTIIVTLMPVPRYWGDVTQLQ